MENSAEIIEAVRDVVRQRGGTGSDYSVANALDISREAMSKRKRGVIFTMADDTAIRAAEIIGLDPAYLLAIVHAEQSERGQRPEAAATWRRMAEVIKTGKRAAMVAGFFLAGAVLSVIVPAKTAYAAPGGALLSQPIVHALYIMSKLLTGLFSAFLGLFRPHPRPVFGC